MWKLIYARIKGTLPTTYQTSGLVVLAIFELLSCAAVAGAPPEFGNGWVVARSPHFEVYSDAGADRAKAALTHFEELRSFFEANHLVQFRTSLERKAPIRVIGFASKQEYDSFKIRATADAYYNGTPDRDYIVMPLSASSDFSVAAHEYAHFLLHSAGLNLPSWLNEGLAEVFSTVSISGKRCGIGGQIPARVQTLRRDPWLSASQLFRIGPDPAALASKGGAAVFYAESWAVVDMLTSSTEYAARFGDLTQMLRSGEVSSEQALAHIYKRPAEAILKDAQDWVTRNRSSRHMLPSPEPETIFMQIAQASQSEVRVMLADLLLANGDLHRAEQIYKEVLKQIPANPEVLGSLGAVALRKGDKRGAVQYWHSALDHGLADATLCYRYAAVADELELPSNEIESALERAIRIRPDFQDALYKLALLKSNAGEYSAAVDDLKSMTKPRADRAFAYWTALAYALAEVGRREESESAADQAMKVAGSLQERARAAELAYVAKTDLAVRFARDADGKMQLVTTRVPHGTTDFNPFVEPGDRLQVITGTLREVQCSGGRLTGFLVESQGGLLTLAVPDPLHVLVRKGPSEFHCGPQMAQSVKAEYAAAAEPGAGVLRGLEFR